MENESRPLQGLFFVSGALSVASIGLTVGSTALFAWAWQTSEYKYDAMGSLPYHLARLGFVLDAGVSIGAVVVYLFALTFLVFRPALLGSSAANGGAWIAIVGLPLKTLSVWALFFILLALRWTHWGYSGVTYGRPVRGKDGYRVPLFGQGWKAVAQAEANSVTAFAQLEHELLAYDAPKELLEWIRRAAVEEGEHARKAAEEGGFLPPDPVSLPNRPVPPLAQIAVETLEDGCLNESYGAQLAALGAQGNFWPTIAVEEADHAELSWAVLHFCVEKGGPEVRAAIHRQLRALRWWPGFFVSPSLGMPGRRKQWGVHLQVRAEVVRRVQTWT